MRGFQKFFNFCLRNGMKYSLGNEIPLMKDVNVVRVVKKMNQVYRVLKDDDDWQE